ncbi:MAG: tetratricopeptide repeat protein [bacterium]|nr:tetratricopeptide repeat protein [bacterium]
MYKFRDELVAEAIAHLEAVANQQASEPLKAVVQNMKAGRVIESEPVFQSVTDAYVASKAVTPAQRSQAFINLAAVCLQDNGEKAKGAFLKAVQVDKDNIKPLALLAHLAMMHRQMDESETYAAKAVQLPATGANVKWQAVANEDLGVLHHMKGDFARAEEFYSKAITGFKQAGDEMSAAEATGNLGLILRRQKKFQEAQAMFLKSLVTWDKNNRQKEIINTLGYLGSLHFIMKDYKAAIENFSRRAKLNEAKNDTAELAADYANMGNAWSKLANGPEACKNLQQAKELYGSVGKAKEAKIVAGLLAKHE